MAHQEAQHRDVKQEPDTDTSGYGHNGTSSLSLLRLHSTSQFEIKEEVDVEQEPALAAVFQSFTPPVMMPTNCSGTSTFENGGFSGSGKPLGHFEPLPLPSTSSGHTSASASLFSLQGLVQEIGNPAVRGAPGTNLTGLQEVVQHPDTDLPVQNTTALQDSVQANEQCVNPSQRPKAANPFHVDTSLIQAVPASQQVDVLQHLGLQVFNQDDFEQGV